MPWIGGLLGRLAVRAAIRRKGFMRGAFDTGLNALPYVGAVKLGAESVRGRDFIEDLGAAPRR